MSIALVQSQKAAGGGTVTLGSNITVGNLLLCQKYVFGATARTAPTDSLSNTWVEIGTGFTATNQNVAMFYAKVTNGGSCVVTPNGTSQTCVSEWSGHDATTPVDVFDNGATATNQFPTSTSITPTGNCAVVSLVCYNNSNKGPTKGAAYTNLQIDAANGWGTEYKITTAGATTADWSLTDAFRLWVVNVVALKEASGVSSSIKTVNGLAKASVKTVNGLAIASVKTVNGLA